MGREIQKTNLFVGLFYGIIFSNAAKLAIIMRAKT